MPLLPLWAVRHVQSFSRAIPLLPLWAVRPVQSFSRAMPLLPLWAVQPVQSLSRAMPLLPLWAVRPVQSFSACTRGVFYLRSRVVTSGRTDRHEAVVLQTRLKTMSEGLNTVTATQRS